MSIEGKPGLMQAAADREVQLCLVEEIPYVKDGMVDVVVANPGFLGLSYPSSCSQIVDSP